MGPIVCVGGTGGQRGARSADTVQRPRACACVIIFYSVADMPQRRADRIDATTPMLEIT